jgi:bis(5'-nucleosidyl)-tetraphosphatase
MKNMLEQAIGDPVIEKRHVAAGVILRKTDGDVDEVLLIQRAKKDFWPHQWEFPKGHCEPGKDKHLRDCAVREIKEETGLDVKPGDLIDKYKYVRLEHNKKIISICYNYKCRLLNPNQEVRLSKEHEAFKWVSEVGEVELMTTPEQKKTIQKVLNRERTIVSYPVHKKTEESVDFYLNTLHQEDVMSGILAGTGAGATGIAAKAGLMAVAPHLIKIYFAAMLIKMATDAYKNNFSKAAKACKGYGEGEKKICMLRAQITAKKAGLEKLQGNISHCSKDKNPEGCRVKISTKIQTMQQEIQYLMQRENELRGKA